MDENPISWFEIYVNDMQRAVAFYETVLDVKLDVLQAPNDDDGVSMRSFPMDQGRYGAGGALVHMSDVKPGGGMSTLVYFACADVAVPESRVAAAGGKVERPKFSIGEYGFISLIIDTEGNMIGLHSQQ